MRTSIGRFLANYVMDISLRHISDVIFRESYLVGNVRFLTDEAMGLSPLPIQPNIFRLRTLLRLADFLLTK